MTTLSPHQTIHRGMTTRGMTIVELLLALALLSGLMVASVSWTTATTRTLAVEGGRARWEAAAARALDVLDKAFLVEDRTLRSNARERWLMAATDDSITVRTRALLPGASGTPRISGLLRLRANAGVLHAVYLDDDARKIRTRALLGGTESLVVSVTELDRHEVEVVVTLVGTSGATAERSWRLPKEAVR